MELVSPAGSLLEAVGVVQLARAVDAQSDVEPGVSEERLLEAMVAHPILVNRPIVATPKGVRLCRPGELAGDLLE